MIISRFSSALIGNAMPYGHHLNLRLSQLIPGMHPKYCMGLSQHLPLEDRASHEDMIQPATFHALNFTCVQYYCGSLNSGLYTVFSSLHSQINQSRGSASPSPKMLRNHGDVTKGHGQWACGDLELDLVIFPTLSYDSKRKREALRPLHSSEVTLCKLLHQSLCDTAAQDLLHCRYHMRC